MRKTIKKLKGKLAKWLMKDCPIMQPIEPIIIKPEKLKRFHSQRIIPHFGYHYSQVDPDYFVWTFRFDVVNELLNEILIKLEETPDGVMMSCDLLFENI